MDERIIVLKFDFLWVTIQLGGIKWYNLRTTLHENTSNGSKRERRHIDIQAQTALWFHSQFIFP
jgi:hypothetical protein